MTAERIDQTGTAEAQIGEIVRLDRHGLAILKTKRDGRLYPFTFDKIRRYRGEFPKEIGLQRGAEVRFTTEDDKINDVEILPKAV
jgi:hypothetical protein